MVRSLFGYAAVLLLVGLLASTGFDFSRSEPVECPGQFEPYTWTATEISEPVSIAATLVRCKTDGTWDLVVIRAPIGVHENTEVSAIRTYEGEHPTDNVAHLHLLSTRQWQ